MDYGYPASIVGYRLCLRFWGFEGHEGIAPPFRCARGDRQREPDRRLRFVAPTRCWAELACRQVRRALAWPAVRPRQAHSRRRQHPGRVRPAHPVGDIWRPSSAAGDQIRDRRHSQRHHLRSRGRWPIHPGGGRGAARQFCDAAESAGRYQGISPSRMRATFPPLARRPRRWRRRLSTGSRIERSSLRSRWRL